MPSYNHARFLPTTLDSVFTQSFTDWELIAVDDGSKDDSARVLQSSGDPRVRVFENASNLGTYGTLAKALSMASGELVAVLDSDDKWEPTKLELQVALLGLYPQIDACYTAGRAFGDSGLDEDVHGGWPESEVQEVLPYLLEENRILASSVIFRRSTVAFDSTMRYSGDWEALLRSARRGPLGFVAKPVTGWRQHDHNSFVRSPGQVAEEIRLRQSILADEEYWQVREVSVRAGLSKCAMHLSALLVLEGRIGEARNSARVALRLNRSPQTLKRLAIVSLPKSAAIKKLWPGSEGFQSSGNGPLIRFNSPHSASPVH
jgi:glycosyltransferase involved in cell wall biosynthesis